LKTTIHLFLSVFFAALVAAAFAISFATIIYSGELSIYLNQGVAMTLLGTIVIALTGAFTLSYKGSILGAQDVPAILLASGAAAIVANNTIDPDAMFATVACLVAITSLVTGLLGMTLGKLRLAHVMRIFPYPVLAGFLATTGLLLLIGGLELALGPEYSGKLSEFVLAENVLRWLPAFVLALLICIATRVFNGSFVMPMALMVSLVLLYVFYLAIGYDVSSLGTAGFLLGPFHSGGFVEAVDPWVVLKADWSIILSNTPLVFTAAVSALIGMTLNASGLELELKRDFDLNKEVRGGGLANLLSGLVGGIPGYHFVGQTLLANRLGLRTSLAGLSAAGGCALLFLFGGSLLNLLPIAFFAAIIAFLGLDLLYSWVWVERRQLRIDEYAIVLAIPLTAVTFGFLNAIAVGLLLSCAIFIFEYSRLNIIRMESDVATRRSRVERPASELLTLTNAKGRAKILELSTFIFFGSSQTLRAKVQQMLEEEENLGWVVLDFKNVPGLDVSAQHILRRIQGDCDAANVSLVLSGLQSRHLIAVSLDGTGFEHQPTLYAAIAKIEDYIITEAAMAADDRTSSDTDLVAFLKGKKLKFLTETRTYTQDELIIANASETRDIFVLLKGKLRVVAAYDMPKEILLAKILPGVTVGEMAFYTHRKRSASIVADETSELLFLDGEKLDALEKDDAALAAEFHRLVARSLALRLNMSNGQLLALES
jgi:SulP family sulfate permease